MGFFISSYSCVIFMKTRPIGSRDDPCGEPDGQSRDQQSLFLHFSKASKIKCVETCSVCARRCIFRNNTFVYFGKVKLSLGKTYVTPISITGYNYSKHGSAIPCAVVLVMSSFSLCMFVPAYCYRKWISLFSKTRSLHFLFLWCHNPTGA